MIRISIKLLLLLLTTSTYADRPRLPEPLTIHAALSVIGDDHPEIISYISNVDTAQAEAMAAAAQDDLSIDLSLEARYIEPGRLSIHDEHNDSRITLSAYKSLYDFGRTSHAINAGNHHILSAQLTRKLAESSLRLRILQQYFAVILADIDSGRATEAMSMQFVRLAKSRDRQELGELSDIEVLKLEDQYQETLLIKTRADEEQRNSRALLALLLNHPEQLSETLTPVDLPGNNAPLPDLSQLKQEALENNLTLLALREELASLEEARLVIKAARRPSLFLALEAIEYERTTPSRDPFTATLGLQVPIYQGNRVDASVAKSAAKINDLKAEIIRAEYDLQHQILTQWQTIRSLMLQKKQADIKGDYRDLYLDRSRAQYELELVTDLGNALVEQSNARLFLAETNFAQAMAREKLSELTGNPNYSALIEPSVATTNNDN